MSSTFIVLPASTPTDIGKMFLFQDSGLAEVFALYLVIIIIVNCVQGRKWSRVSWCYHLPPSSPWCHHHHHRLLLLVLVVVSESIRQCTWHVATRHWWYPAVYSWHASRTAAGTTTCPPACVRQYTLLEWMDGWMDEYEWIWMSSQAVVRKHNKPRPCVAHRGIARFLGFNYCQKCNPIVPWSLINFPESFVQIGPAVFS